MHRFYDRNPHYKQEIKRGRAKIMENFKPEYGRSVPELEILTIPVHTIIVHRPGESVGFGTNISHARIQAQIDVLNRDFQRRNDDRRGKSCDRSAHRRIVCG